MGINLFGSKMSVYYIHQNCYLPLKNLFKSIRTTSAQDWKRWGIEKKKKILPRGEMNRHGYLPPAKTLDLFYLATISANPGLLRTDIENELTYLSHRFSPLIIYYHNILLNRVKLICIEIFFPEGKQ